MLAARRQLLRRHPPWDRRLSSFRSHSPSTQSNTARIAASGTAPVQLDAPGQAAFFGVELGERRHPLGVDTHLAGAERGQLAQQAQRIVAVAQ